MVWDLRSAYNRNNAITSFIIWSLYLNMGKNANPQNLKETFLSEEEAQMLPF